MELSLPVCRLKLRKPFPEAPSRLSLLSHWPALCPVPKAVTRKENGITSGSSRLSSGLGDGTHFLLRCGAVWRGADRYLHRIRVLLAGKKREVAVRNGRGCPWSSSPRLNHAHPIIWPCKWLLSCSSENEQRPLGVEAVGGG